MPWNQLVLATRNAGKVREFQLLLSDLGVQIVGLDPAFPDVEETGTTFEENALIKARAACAAAGLPALGEDSGLAVDALDGEPGVRSARWVPGSDADRLHALLRRLEAIPEGQRPGRYVSCIAIVTPDGKESVVRGEWEGAIALAPEGSGGFGYDPIFRLADGRTAAMLTMAEKNAQSHRSRALALARQRLPELLGR